MFHNHIFGRLTTQDCIIITTIKKDDVGHDDMAIKKYNKDEFANFNPEKLLNKLTDEHSSIMNRAVMRRAFERGRVNLFLVLPV